MESSINVPNQNIDLTVRVFDSFYEFGIEVDANTYDVVNSYFESVCADKQIARSFTVSLFRIAEQTKVPVLSLLEQVGGQSPGTQTEIQLSNTMVYYLNGIRSPATLLGLNGAITPNYWAARNVLL